MTESAARTIDPIESHAEAARLAALIGYEILDTPPEEAFDRLVRLAAATFGAPIALVSLVDRDRQWFKACRGLALTETPRDGFFCAHAIRNSDLFLVPDAGSDPRFRDSALVTGPTSIRFYAGAPLVTETGARLGTLCVIDTVARPEAKPEDYAQLTELAAVVVDLIEARMTSTLLRRKAAELEAIYNSVPVGIAVVDRDLRHRSINERLAAVNGLPAAAHVGRTLREMVPALADTLEPIYRQIFESGRPQTAVMISGTTPADPQRMRTWECSFNPVLDDDGAVTGVSVVAHDVTESRMAETTLRKREEGFRLLFDANPTPMWVYDRKSLAILRVNESAVRSYGYSRDCFERMQTVDMLPAEDRDRVAAALRAGDYAITAGISRHVRHDGSRIAVEIASTNLDLDTGPARLVAAFDVTLQRQRETELRQARDQAETADRAKTHFLANMSHELRTPLNAIIGFSDLLQHGIAGVLTRKQSEYIEDIQTSGHHLLALVDEVLDLSKITSGYAEISREPVDLAAVAASALMLVEGAARQRGVRLRERIEPGLPPVVGDETRIKQILVNLMSNSIKFTDRDGSVELVTGREDGHAVIEVRDTGIGMTRQQIELARQPFRQVDASLSRHREGIGLGLPIAETLVKLHGASMTIDSTVGVGTTVRIVFPS